MDNKKLSDVLGFYFVIFQTTTGNFVKCWINGSDDYTYYDRDQFIGFCNKLGSNYKVECDIIEALSTFSLYMWDVDNNSVKHLSPDSSGEYSDRIKGIFSPLH